MPTRRTSQATQPGFDSTPDGPGRSPAPIGTGGDHGLVHRPARRSRRHASSPRQDTGAEFSGFSIGRSPSTPVRDEASSPPSASSPTVMYTRRQRPRQSPTRSRRAVFSDSISSPRISFPPSSRHSSNTGSVSQASPLSSSASDRRTSQSQYQTTIPSNRHSLFMTQDKRRKRNDAARILNDTALLIEWARQNDKTAYAARVQLTSIAGGQEPINFEEWVDVIGAPLEEEPKVEKRSRRAGRSGGRKSSGAAVVQQSA